MPALRGRRRPGADPERGATSVEYALLAGFIAVVAAAAFLGLGQVVLGLYEQGKGALTR